MKLALLAALLIVASIPAYGQVAPPGGLYGSYGSTGWLVDEESGIELMDFRITETRADEQRELSFDLVLATLKAPVYPVVQVIDSSGHTTAIVEYPAFFLDRERAQNLEELTLKSGPVVIISDPVGYAITEEVSWDAELYTINIFLFKDAEYIQFYENIGYLVTAMVISSDNGASCYQNEARCFEGGGFSNEWELGRAEPPSGWTYDPAGSLKVAYYGTDAYLSHSIAYNLRSA